MKIGFLSDAHGNPEGLERCLGVLLGCGVDATYFLGDAVGYFSGWREVLGILRENQVQCILGNHDQVVLEGGVSLTDDSAYQFLAAYREDIEEYLGWMATWPQQMTLSCDGKELLLVHGSPFDQTNGYVYPWSDLLPFSQLNPDIVVMGHTHRPFLEKVVAKTIMNVGSCGLPRDVGNLASCATYDSVTEQCEIYRIEMKIERILSRVRAPHPVVVDCLNRVAKNFVGKLTSERSDER